MFCCVTQTGCKYEWKRRSRLRRKTSELRERSRNTSLPECQLTWWVSHYWEYQWPLVSITLTLTLVCCLGPWLCGLLFYDHDTLSLGKYTFENAVEKPLRRKESAAKNSKNRTNPFSVERGDKGGIDQVKPEGERAEKFLFSAAVQEDEYELEGASTVFQPGRSKKYYCTVLMIK